MSIAVLVERGVVMSASLGAELAAAAARLVVEEGLEYGPAKRRAARLAGRSAPLPANDQIEDAVREYLALFCAESQPAELVALRRLAEKWMQRLAEFRPHLTGAVWRGTATRRSAVHLQLYCDDSKAAELALIDEGVRYQVGSTPGPRGARVDVLSVGAFSDEFGEEVTVHLTVLDHDDLRGALKPDARGANERGNLAALRRLMQERACSGAS